MQVIDIPLTELLSPLRESLSHFKKSWDGVSVISSALTIGRVFIAVLMVAFGIAVVTTREAADAPAVEYDDDDACMGGRTGPGTIDDDLPLWPTVVQGVFVGRTVPEGAAAT